MRIKSMVVSDHGKITVIPASVEQMEREVRKIKGLDLKDIEVVVRKAKSRRSLDANAYMWELCEEIAKAVHGTKEEIYRKAIREVGVFTDVAVVSKAVPALVDDWTAHGVGWIAEVSDSKLKGCKRVRLYTGSSHYDTKEMSRLIDWIVEEAKQLGIETAAEAELTRLAEEWGRR